jgi:hypothetical protein
MAEATQALFSDIEAARWLRLTDDAPNDDAALKRLARLVDSGLLRPCIVGKRRRFWIEELTDFCRRETEKYGGRK